MKILKGLICCILVCCLSYKAFCIDTPWLHADGNQIKDPSGNVVVLRGVSLIDLGHLEGWEGGIIASIDRLTNLGDTQGSYTGWYPRVLRLPIAPPDTVNWPNEFTTENDWYYLNILRPTVDYCAEKGVYVIIDWHDINNTYDRVNEASAFWEYIAPKFANDSHVIYELFNEPINSVGNATDNWLSVRDDMQTWIDIVRTYAPNNLILVGGPSWDQQIGPAATYPVSDPIGNNNIAYVAHMYAGHWRWSNSYRAHIETCSAVYPVFMSEWGFSQSTCNYDSSHRYYGTITEYGQPLMDFLDAHQIGNTAWVSSWTWGPRMFYSDWTLRSGEGEMGCFVKDNLYLKRYDDLPYGYDPEVPGAPTGLSAVSQNARINLYWDDNTEEDLVGYNVYRSEASGSGFEQINSVLLTTSEFIDNSASTFTTYYYVITAIDSDNNESLFSDECYSKLPDGGIGTLLCQWWDGIGGSSLDTLYDSVDYPDNPSETDYLNSAEVTKDRGDSYGTRLRGYLYPPETGDYTFWIASDGGSQLWLSTDGSSENAALIAEVPDYTNYRQWDKYASQESSVITLDADKKYYIEVVHVEDSGTDHLSVAWNGPSLIFRRIIDGDYLSPAILEDSYGDFNGDGYTDIEDLTNLITLWLKDDCIDTAGMDCNGNCVMDMYELSILSQNWAR